MRLYAITETDVEHALSNPREGPENEGGRTVVVGPNREKFRGMPLKVVYVVEGTCTVIISAYPLKKRYWRERQ